MVTRLKPLALSLAVAGILSANAPALGACVFGQPPSYDDVVAVLFERDFCGGLGGQPKDPPLRCSGYYLFFWNIHPGATYSQWASRRDRGTYHIDAGLQQAIDVLRKDQFFLLSPGEHDVTDIRETKLTVRHCGVVTRLMMFPLSEFDPKTNAIFADFDALVEHSKKEKISDTPQDFKYTLLFEGQ